MEILILLLVSPAIFAQRFRKQVNPNDEPFLPIHPVYPYNPKLTKRGFDKEIMTVLKPELYVPRTDARDSYTASYAGNTKDSYFPGYGSPHSSVAPYSPYSSYHGNNLYGVYMNPYMANPYSANPYGSGAAHSSNSYAGYYNNQSPYYYPDYYHQPVPYSYQPQDHSVPQGPPWNENSNREYSSSKSAEKTKQSKSKVKENSSSSSSGSQNQFVDGNNLISQNFNDLTAQSSAYQTSNLYNQLEQISDHHFKNVPIRPSTYKVISVGGQHYSLPGGYPRAQPMEQGTAVKNLAKSLGHLFPHQMTGTQGPQDISSYLHYAGTVGQQSLLGKPSHELINPVGKIQEGQYYSDDSNAPEKSVEAHIYGSDDRDLPDKESNNQFVTVNRDSSSKLTNVQIYGDRHNNPQTEYAIGQGEEGLEILPQNLATSIKIPSKYQSLPCLRKPGTKVTFQRSQSSYIPPVKITQILEEADLSSIQSYDQPPSLSDGMPYRSDQNYRQDQMQGMIPYQNIGQGTPQAYTYHQTNNVPLQQQQQEQQQHKTNLEDVNFGAKQGNKG